MGSSDDALTAEAMTEARHESIDIDAEPDIIAEAPTESAQAKPVDLPPPPPPPQAEPFVTLTEHEKRYIQQVLDASNGDKERAAEILGITKSTLTRKLKG